MSNKNQRLNATITIGSVLEASVKRNVGVLKSGLSEVGKSIKEVERRQKELDRQRNVLRRQGKSVEDLDREYEQLERTLKDLHRTQERWNNAAAASRRVGASFKGVSDDFRRLGKRVTVGATAAGAAIFSLANSTAQTAREVQLLSQVANTSPRNFQRMAAGAASVGIEQEKLADILKDVNDRVGDFLETGGGPMADFFENIGPKVGVTIDHFRNLSGDDALLLYVDSLQKAGLSQQEMTFYLEAMASDTTALLPLLRDGASELKRLGDAAENTGRILDEEAIQRSAEYRSELSRIQGVIVGLRNTIGTALLPAVTRTTKQIGDALVANRDDMKSWAEAFADGVERALPLIGEVATGIGTVSAIVWDVIDSTAQMVGGWENFGMVIGAVLASRTIIRLGKFGAAVFGLGKAMLSLALTTPLVLGGLRAIGAALLLNPIGLAVTAIAGGAALIYSNWETVGPWFKALWDGIGAVFDTVWTTLVKPVIDGLSSTGGIGAAWDAVKSALDQTLTWIGEKFAAAMTFIKPVIDALKWAIENAQAAGNAIGSIVGRKNNGSVMDNPEAAAAAEKRAQSGQPSGLDRLRGNTPAGVRGPSVLNQFQTNALGGPFRPGWHLTGELGPELKFENRAGYVANNRALRQIAGYADRVGALMERPFAVPRHAGAEMKKAARAMGRQNRPAWPQRASDKGMAARVEALFASGGSGARAAAAATGQVTQNITYTIHAAGASAEEVIRLVERKSRLAAGNGLFDRMPSTGPYGR